MLIDEDRVSVGVHRDEAGGARGALVGLGHQAAQAMAAPKLRFAIETAASSRAAEDRAVEAALAELEIEDTRARAAEDPRFKSRSRQSG